MAARRQAPAEMSLLVQARSRLSWVSQSRKVTALVVSQNRDSKLTGANSRNISFESPSPPSAGPRGHFKHASRRRHRRYVRPGNGALARSQVPEPLPSRPRRAVAAIARGETARETARFWFPVSDAGIRARTRAGLARFLCVSARHLASAPRAGGRASRSNPERSDSTRHPKSARA